MSGAIPGADVVYNLSASDSGIMGVFKSVELRALAVGAAITTAFGFAIKSAMDLEGATAKLSFQLGGQAEDYKELIKEAYGDNFGESIRDVGRAFGEVGEQLLSVGVKSQKELDTLTRFGLRVESLFSEDVASSAGAAATLMDNFGLSAEQATDFIASGFERGLNASDDFLDSLREYSNQFAEGGMDAAEFFSVLETGMQGGVLGTDKAADIFKEFRARILDGSKATGEALSMLGIKSTEFLREISTGQRSVASAFQEVQQRMRQTGDASVQMQAGVGLMGAMFEDLGYQAFNGINVAATSMEELTGAGERVTASMGTTEASLKSVWREVVTLAVEVGDKLAPALKTLLETVRPLLQGLTWLAKTFPNITAGLIGIAGAALFVTKVVIPLTAAMKGLGLATSLLAGGSAAAGVAGAAGAAGSAGGAGLGAVAIQAASAGGGLSALAGGATAATIAAAPLVIALGAVVFGLGSIFVSAYTTKQAQDDLKESTEELAKAEQKYAEGAGKRAEEEKIRADMTARAWFEHYNGRKESEEEFAQMRNLMLNKEIDAQEAALFVSLELGEEKTIELMRMGEQETQARLEQLGIMRRAEEEHYSAVTEMIRNAAAARQAEWSQIMNQGGPLMAGPGQAFPVAGAMTQGGHVSRPGAYVVGEYGSEVVSLPRGSSVTSSGRLEAMFRAATAAKEAVVNVNFGRVSVRHDADIPKLSQELAKQIRVELRAAGMRA